MRLIDADKLILHLNDFMLQQSPIDVQDIESINVSAVIQDCIKAIENQPTAYDVDKVIEEIEEWTARINVINDNSGKVGQVDVIGSNKAIKIVEGGGVSGDN
ncbi:hypothetical protein [Eubacterium ventriosum]|uniref:hypothetical protein n=1 Tax=Eubacterium ventriosum TaxID=39496 RepID=UPI001C00EDCD|nr:hypothetical protein [Eubacterium ventriosum]MBT9699164.1 hypothetical protein [Eubacterium ventriosum]